MKILYSTFIFLCTFALLNAQEPPKKELKIQQLGNEKIKLDGLIDDKFWLTATFHDDFLVKEPNEGEKPGELTKFAIAYDNDAIYFAARMYRKDIEGIRTTAFKRDNTFNAEKIILVLDSYFDKRTSYSFLVTAVGSLADYVSNNDSEYSRDYTYNPVWEGKANIDSLGWTCEMRIPFTQLRFSHSDTMRFGLNINQYTPSSREDIYYVLIPRRSFGWSSKFAELSGFENIKPTTRLELQPYLNGRVTQNPFYDKSNPLAKETERNLNYGLDIKFGITQDITLDATVLPDFGQVELDPSIVNLSAYEVYYSERRPFFTEGKQIFDRMGDLFYSRRIGGVPHGALGNGLYNNVPKTTNILGAAKFSGRLANKLSIAGLSALTEKVYADYTSGNSQYQQEIEPLASYNLFRIEKEFDVANSYIALSATGVERSLCDCNNLINILPKRAYTGALDFQYRLFDGNYSINTTMQFSHLYGSKEAILQRQKAPARFLQRPNSLYKVNDLLNEMNGYALGVNFQKHAGDHWLWGLNYKELSPYFDLNDLGRVQAVDNRTFDSYITYRDLQQTDYYYSYAIKAYNYLQYDYAGLLLRNSFGLYSQYVFTGRDQVELTLQNYADAYSNSETRGGPAMLMPNRSMLSLYYSSDFSRRTTYNGNIEYHQNKVGSHYFYTSAFLKSQVLDKLELSIGANFTNNLNKAQYITTVINSKNRYIFGEISQITLGIDLRANYIFTPTLTLELYMQPFTSNGAYTNFGELAKPLTNELTNYGNANGTKIEIENGRYLVTDGNETFYINKPDFNIIAFRSNLVLRWEWVRGSFLYLVWQATSETFDSVLPFHTNNIFDSFTNTKMNVVALKFSYWLPAKL